MRGSPVVPNGLFDSRPYGFAQVAVVPTPFGRAVHVSGQVAWDADQNIVGPGDIGRQLEKSLDNLAAAPRSGRSSATTRRARPGSASPVSPTSSS